MSNVLKFPKAKAPLPAVELNVDTIRAALPRGTTLKAVLSGLWLLLRLPAFLVLYWLRLPVMLVCNLIATPTLLLWLFSWYAFPDKTVMVWGFAVISFVAFTLGWVYDLLLVAISPLDMVQSL